MARSLHVHCQRPGFKPGGGAETPQATVAAPATHPPPTPQHRLPAGHRGQMQARGDMRHNSADLKAGSPSKGLRESLLLQDNIHIVQNLVKT